MKAHYGNWARLLLLCLSCLLLFMFSLPSPVVLSQTPLPLRIGYMGDSTIDEYRGTDNRGGVFASVTFNWMEQILRRRNVYSGVFKTWPEPRRLGYEYNWARSASTAQNLIDEKQPVGLAAQVAAGQIDVVVMAVGNQDFAPYNANGYQPIYDGTLTDAQVTAKVNAMIANYTSAVDTVLSARQPPVPIVVTTISDVNLSPLVLTNPQYSDPAKRQRVEDAIAAVNAGITSMAAARGLPVFDTQTFTLSLLGQAPNGILTVDGVNIDLKVSGDDPHDGILGDKIHAGTVTEGLIANQYIGLINQLIDPDIPPLSNQEILGLAGLAPLPPTPSNTPIPTPTRTPTPKPSLPDAAPVLNYYTALPLVLDWERVNGAIHYEVEVATSSNFASTSLVTDTITSGDDAYMILSSVDDGTYFWRVRAQIGETGWGAWSTPEGFTVNVR